MVKNILNDKILIINIAALMLWYLQAKKQKQELVIINYKYILYFIFWIKK